MESKIGYKIVSEQDELLTSCIMEDLAAKVEYKVGEWVKPKRGCGPLILFNSLEHAIEFDRRQFMPMKPIYKCEFIPNIKLRPLYDFQNKFLLPKYFPKGAILAKTIKLVELVFDGSLKQICENHLLFSLMGRTK